MQSSYAERFTREMGCTEVEWLRWLPAAMGSVPWSVAQQTLAAQLGGAAHLMIGWRVAPDRQIATVRMPVLVVDFAFAGTDIQQRYAFMKRFDLYMHRGGG